MNDSLPIYKEINGKLIQIKEKDPSKLYGSVHNVTTGESYIKEYTELEESEARKQKELWDADEPKRKAEEERIRLEQQTFYNSLKYSKKIVAFIDILGWSPITKEVANKDASYLKPIGEALLKIKGISKHYKNLRDIEHEQGYFGNPEYSYFSDSIAFSINNSDYGISILEQVLSVLSDSLLDSGFLVRGGISYGDIYHKDGLIFGPALVDAYNLECNKAGHPRIIISDSLRKLFLSRNSYDCTKWVEDKSDNKVFYNFLPPFNGSAFFIQNDIYDFKFNKVRELILVNLNNDSLAEKIKAKYIWLKEYYNDCCLRVPTLNLPLVD